MNKARQADTSPAMEWMLGGVGVLLFVCAVAFLAFEGIQGADKPGAIIVRVEEILPTTNGFLVRYSARNLGSQTLVDLHVSAGVFDGSVAIDNAQGVIDFLPGDSVRRGGFYLREDPRRYRLEIRPEGYQDP